MYTRKSAIPPEITAEKKRVYLETARQTGLLLVAKKQARISNRMLIMWKRDDPEFNAAYEEIVRSMPVHKQRIIAANNRPHPEKRIEDQKIFLDTFERTGSIAESTRAAQITPGQHNRWAESYPSFAEQLAGLKEMWKHRIDDEVRNRAMIGRERIVVSQGRVVYNKDGTPLKETIPSDYLLAFLARATWPEKYREQRQVVINTGQININSAKEDLLKKLQRQANQQEQIRPEVIDGYLEPPSKDN